MKTRCWDWTIRALNRLSSLPDAVVSAQGMGPSNPVADNKTADGRKQNRRVEIEVTVDQSKVPADAK